MKASLKKDRNMDQAFGEGVKETHILENGNRARLMAMEYIHGLMGIVMKDSLVTVSNMEKVLKYSVMEIYIEDHI